jgi:hypothetical protein
LKRNLRLDLIVGDASDYKFGPSRVDLVALFYHTDRNLFPKLVSALNPGGLLLCKLSLRWGTAARLTAVGSDPLIKNELPSLVPELDTLQERPVLDRSVVECRGKMEEGEGVNVRSAAGKAPSTS